MKKISIQSNPEYNSPNKFFCKAIIENIVKKLNISIEIGGGIRSVEKIKAYLNIGVDKVILGSAAIKNPDFLKQACEEFKNN